MKNKLVLLVALVLTAAAYSASAQSLETKWREEHQKGRNRREELLRKANEQQQQLKEERRVEPAIPVVQQKPSAVPSVSQQSMPVNQVRTPGTTVPVAGEQKQAIPNPRKKAIVHQ